MARKSIITISAILVVIAAIFVAYLYIEKNRNKETTVDLGNGWKSYSHENIGFTVKIPEDAEIEAGAIGDKNENFIATFSKGDIKEIITMYCCGIGSSRDPKNIKDVHDYYDVHNDKDYEWTYLASTKENADFSREIIIDNKVVTFDFSLSPFPQEGDSNDALRLVARYPQVLGKERLHAIRFKSIDTIIPKLTEDGTPRSKEVINKDIEEFVNEKIELVKDLVISIDSF